MTPKRGSLLYALQILLAALLLGAVPGQAHQPGPTPSPGTAPLPSTGHVPPSGKAPWVGRAPIRYPARSGDSLAAVAARFRVQPAEILSPQPLPQSGLLAPGQLLLIPPLGLNDLNAPPLLPDSEIVYGPSAVGFDIPAELDRLGGYLARHREYLNSTAWTAASTLLFRVAQDNSVNPRLLISLLEWECGCATGQTEGRLAAGYVLGVEDFRYRWLYGQLSWAALQLSSGYYGWREGSLREFTLPDGTLFRPAADASPATVALQYYFAQVWAAHARTAWLSGRDYPEGRARWQAALDPRTGLPALHARLFGDPWERDRQAGPLFPAGARQPEMILPFEPGRVWSYTSGPHRPWDNQAALAALDFAPAANQTGCIPSDAWVVAVADGPVVRTAAGMVMQDLDGPQPSDGVEQTGWAVLYMHIATEGQAPAGAWLHSGDRVGRPSCEGGPATGTHLHIARKYNGEWVAAGGALPFVLGGWTAHAGAKPLEGSLTCAERTITASLWGTTASCLTRPTPEARP